MACFKKKTHQTFRHIVWQSGSLAISCLRNHFFVNVVDVSVSVASAAPALGYVRQAYIYAACALHCQRTHT